MDLNLIVIAGRLASEPELRTFESGATLVRLLVTVRQEEPRHRIDVVPVVMWNPDLDHEMFNDPARGRSVWLAGSLQRRFWGDKETGRRSGIEVVAHEVSLNQQEVRVHE
jgi:single-stranded DNA-binding protein